MSLLTPIRDVLLKGEAARSVKLTSEQEEIVKNYNIDGNKLTINFFILI